MNFSEIRDINLPKCRMKSDFSSSLLYFFSLPLFLSPFFFSKRKNRVQKRKWEKCRFVNYESRYLGIRTKYSSFARNPGEIGHTLGNDRKFGNEMGIFPLRLFFFFSEKIHEVKQTMNRSIAINAEKYFENMFPVYQLTNNL